MWRPVLPGGQPVTERLRAYGRRAIESIYIKDSGMSAGSEVLLQAKDNDLSIKEVPIHCRYDVERASTQNPVSHGVKTLIKILHDMELRRPLYYFTVPGILLAAVGVGMGAGFSASVLSWGKPGVWAYAAYDIADAGGVLPGHDRDHIAQHIQDDDRVQGGDRSDKKSEQCPWP